MTGETTMIRHPAAQASLGLDSLTDTITNMMGLIILMVAITSIVSGGMKITLLRQLEDPGQRTPIYLVCRDGRVSYMHRGDGWMRELAQICGDMESRLGRKPSTSEALIEANLIGLQDISDYRPMFVRETIREPGGEAYVVGVRFLAADEPVGSGGAAGGAARWESGGVAFTERAREAIAHADPAADYIDVFVGEDDFDTLRGLQEETESRGLRLGWRVLLRHQDPGLSETGTLNAVEGE